MAEQVTIEGKEYISSKRASELSGYAQDYIGQLARGGQIDAQRVGGLWFVFMPALESYKEKAESYKPEPPVRIPNTDPESLLTFDGKDYVSAARAAKITGYHQDYVGQLARSGTILSRQVGNRWYVERLGITAHKREKDALLAAVQVESVGLVRSSSTQMPEADIGEIDEGDAYMTYTHDEADLIPAFGPPQDDTVASTFSRTDIETEARRSSQVAPVRRVTMKDINPPEQQFDGRKKASRVPVKSISYAAIAASVLAVIVVLTIGITTLKGGSMYAAAGAVANRSGVVSTVLQGVEAVAGKVGDVLEAVIVRDLVYKRS